jgi:hypothetical protein
VAGAFVDVDLNLHARSLRREPAAIKLTPGTGKCDCVALHFARVISAVRAW